MSDCCSPEGYRELFSEKSAQAQAKRYRKRGLDPVSRQIVELVKQRDLGGVSVLEVGGGIGAIQLELLKAGAATATSVELTPTYEDAAAELFEEAGFRDQAQREIMDFAEHGSDVAAADVVVLNRVLCCYHDMPRLAGAAAEHAGRLLVLSFPKQRLWTRALVVAANFGLWVARRKFHIFLHPPERIRAVAESRGLRTVHDRPGLFWQVLALERV
ncbi:MAG TPA: methyltransferase domain-containing protein [Solirubrobacterales bacterium]|nr:methyltransferase domain-containing protein [Solirubrobacterales bacterium]